CRRRTYWARPGLYRWLRARIANRTFLAQYWNRRPSHNVRTARTAENSLWKTAIDCRRIPETPSQRKHDRTHEANAPALMMRAAGAAFSIFLRTPSRVR